MNVLRPPPNTRTLYCTGGRCRGSAAGRAARCAADAVGSSVRCSATNGGRRGQSCRTASASACSRGALARSVGRPWRRGKICLQAKARADKQIARSISILFITEFTMIPSDGDIKGIIASGLPPKTFIRVALDEGMECTGILECCDKDFNV